MTTPGFARRRTSRSRPSPGAVPILEIPLRIALCAHMIYIEEAHIVKKVLERELLFDEQVRQRTADSLGQFEGSRDQHVMFAGLQGRKAWLLDTGHLRDLDLCQAGLDSRIAQIAAEYLRRGPLMLRFGRGSLRHSAIVSGFAAEPQVAHCDALAATTPRSPLIVGK